MAQADRNGCLSYQADENPPAARALAYGLQFVVLGITGLVLIPTIVIRAAGATEAYLSWAVFAGVLVSGATTALQAVRIGRLGAGYLLWTGPAGAYIGICVTALVAGGPSLLAMLVVVSSLVPILVSLRLSLFRWLLTPTIMGTVNMLIPATVLPVVFGRLDDVPDGTAGPIAPLIVATTVLVIGGISLKAPPRLRLWAPLLGVVAGTLVAAPFGLYDLERAVRASWIGLPQFAWPGLAFDFGPAVVGLLPTFVFVAVIGAIQTITCTVAVQRVSWRRPRAVDYRAVQGAVAADGAGKLVSGLAGLAVPGQTVELTIPMIQLTGIAARRVGLAVGVVLIALGFLPKALAVILAIPGPVAAAFITVMMTMVFMHGLTQVVRGGMDHRKGMIVGLAFWVGVGCQNGLIFPDHLATVAGGLLQNGITAGGLTAVFMTLFLHATEPRPRRFEADFDLAVLPAIRRFIGDFASRNVWDETMVQRLEAACEETLLTLADREEEQEQGERRRLFLSARKVGRTAVLEFIVSTGEENIQDRIGLLADHPDEDGMEREVSLRLLRHIASSVRHQQFHDTDVVTVQVEAPQSGPRAR